MDLIERAALEREIHEALADGGDIDGAFILNTLDAQKTVEAVPLEPLCEWLSENAGRPIACRGILCNGCEFDDVSNEYQRCWENLIRKWMEEQHEQDQ